MIAAVFFGVVTVLAVLEILSFRASRRVGISFEVDHTLCEPDEEIALRYTISNASALPVLFAAISVYFEGKVHVCEPEEWIKRHIFEDYSGTYMDRKLFLPPHRRVHGRVRFAFEKRGVHPVGKIYLETGDYLGLRSVVRSPQSTSKVICTARLSEQEPDLKPYGGLLGDISVQRFIHDDPCLVIGYREYTGREPMKQISWVQTAKTAQLMVKIQDHTADADVVILVELGAGSKDVMERCLSLTRTVCEDMERRKIPYALISNGDLGDSERGLGKGHLTWILRALGLSNMTRFTEFSDAVERCANQGRPDRSFIVISPDLDEKLLRRLQENSEHRVFILTGEEEERL